jgi:hypothetical protein
MQKKKSKKSWRRNQKIVCDCFYCTGNWFARFITKTRVRRKFQKYPSKVFATDEEI